MDHVDLETRRIQSSGSREITGLLDSDDGRSLFVKRGREEPVGVYDRFNHTQRSRASDGLLPIRGCELGPSSAPVSGFSSRTMGSEVLKVGLPAGSVCSEFFQ